MLVMLVPERKLITVCDGLNKAKQKRFLDNGAGRSLYAQQVIGNAWR